MLRELVVAHSTERDVMGWFYALRQGIVRIPGCELRFEYAPRAVLNRRARHRLYDVTMLSPVAYPWLALDYRPLSSGMQVARANGPLLAGCKPFALDDLSGRTVAVPGRLTTSGFLARWALPESRLVERPFDRIPAEVAAGRWEAGVVEFPVGLPPRWELHPVANLGVLWTHRTGLPFPAGLMMIARDCPETQQQAVCDALRQSVAYASAHPDEAFGTTDDPIVGTAADAVRPAGDVRRALRALLPLIVKLDLAETVPPLDFVEGTTRLLPGAISRPAA